MASDEVQEGVAEQGEAQPTGSLNLDSDQTLRWLIFDHYADATEGAVLIDSMDAIYHWVKEGKKPDKVDEKRPRLKTVSSTT